MADVEEMDDRRRRFLAFFAGTGLSSTLLPGVLWAQTEGSPTKTITVENVINAEKIAGVHRGETAGVLVGLLALFSQAFG